MDPAQITAEEENSEEERQRSPWCCSHVLGAARQLDRTAAELGCLKIEFIYSPEFFFSHHLD